MIIPAEEQEITIQLLDVWIERCRSIAAGQQRRWQERRNRRGWERAAQEFENWRSQIQAGTVSEDVRDGIIRTIKADMRDIAANKRIPSPDNQALINNFQLLINNLQELS